jgi:hypothetical protein
VGFTSDFGGYLCSLFLVGWVLFYFGIKVIAAIDDDGEIKRKANDRFTSWLGGLFK